MKVVDNLEWLNNAHGQTRRLVKLVEDLLLLARSDSGQITISRQNVDIRDVILHVVDLYQDIADLKALALDATVNASAIVSGDRDKLHRVFVVLVDNAMKFTPEGGHIWIRTSQKKNSVFIDITDTGVGMDSDTLKHATDRFYAADVSRTKGDTNQSTGLGMSIAERLLSAHDGSIQVTSAGIGYGTTVTVQLPLVRDW